MSPTVTVDLERHLAKRYIVKSIPQTVVIDAKGDVARLLVDATPQLPKHLRFAIDELLAQWARAQEWRAAAPPLCLLLKGIVP